MSTDFEQSLNSTDWKEITPRLLAYAHMQICKAYWRGRRVRGNASSIPSLDGMSADDFLQQALDRLLEGSRSFNPDFSLEQNLKLIIQSLIWSWNKSCNRRPIKENVSEPDEAELPDAIENVPDQSDAPDVATAAAEEAALRQEQFQIFESQIAGDAELELLLRAYKDGVITPRDVEIHTGIPAVRVSELKRKLATKMSKFIAQEQRSAPTPTL